MTLHVLRRAGRKLWAIAFEMANGIVSTFINKLFNFIGVGLALYMIANAYTWLSNDSVIKHTVKCRFCRKRISEKVSSGPIVCEFRSLLGR